MCWGPLKCAWVAVRLAAAAVVCLMRLRVAGEQLRQTGSESLRALLGCLLTRERQILQESKEVRRKHAQHIKQSKEQLGVCAQVADVVQELSYSNQC